jgi:hypothetical protein
MMLGCAVLPAGDAAKAAQAVPTARAIKILVTVFIMVAASSDSVLNSS